MSNSILDASALIAWLYHESGKEQVAQAIRRGVVMSSVNFSEVIVRLSDDGLPENDIHLTLDHLNINIFAYDENQSYEAGTLRPLTKHLGLSLGDRACLALARQLQLPVLTADRAWKKLSLDIEIHVIR